MRVLIIRDRGDLEFRFDGSISSPGFTYTTSWAERRPTPAKYVYEELEYVLMEDYDFTALCLNKKYPVHHGLTPLAANMNALGYRLFLVKNEFIEQ